MPDGPSEPVYKVLGTRLKIEVDGADAIAPDFERFSGEIDRILEAPGRYRDFVVRLDRPMCLDNDFVVERIFLVGIDMDLVEELFGIPRRPEGLPVLVGMWRVKDDAAIDRITRLDRPPPKEEFLGRGQVALE